MLPHHFGTAFVRLAHKPEPFDTLKASASKMTPQLMSPYLVAVKRFQLSSWGNSKGKKFTQEKQMGESFLCYVNLDCSSLDLI